MNEVFYVPNYTVAKDPNELVALQAVRDKLVGSGANNVFLIDDTSPKSTVTVGPPPLTAMDRIVNHLAMLGQSAGGPPERVNLVGHFGDDGLIIHRKMVVTNNMTLIVAEALTHDPTTWGALGRISVHASASTPKAWLTEKHTLRLLGCLLLDSPKCKTACDGPLMAQAISREYCVKVESTRQVFNATHFDEGSLSTAGASILERVSSLTTLAPRTCCPNSPFRRTLDLVWLPHHLWKKYRLPLASARLRRGDLRPSAMPADLVSGLEQQIGWGSGRESPGLLAVPEVVLDVRPEKGSKLKSFEMVIIADGRAVYTPHDTMLYPIDPDFVPALSAWLDRAGGAASPRGGDGPKPTPKQSRRRRA